MQRSFYYWRTVFNLTPTERKALTDLKVQNLYVKFFDVDWDAATRSAQPVAKSIFSQAPPASLTVTPVVFITQEPLQKLDTIGLNTLAVNIANLLANVSANNKLRLSAEVQIDCDWTQTTKAAYFHFLQRLKQQPFFRGKTVSATVRLHQLKFISLNGVPPVDKGLLMCYNMGNLRHPQTKNSILDVAELKKYINNIDDYPLPLDVALPLFHWWVLFNGDTYKGLLREFEPDGDWKNRRQIEFRRDTTVNGYTFKAGEWLRREGSETTAVKEAVEAVAAKLNGDGRTVILYHLSNRNLDKYPTHELESFYNGFR